MQLDHLAVYWTLDAPGVLCALVGGFGACQCGLRFGQREFGGTQLRLASRQGLQCGAVGQYRLVQCCGCDEVVAGEFLGPLQLQLGLRQAGLQSLQLGGCSHAYSIVTTDTLLQHQPVALVNHAGGQWFQCGHHIPRLDAVAHFERGPDQFSRHGR